MEDFNSRFENVEKIGEGKLTRSLWDSLQGWGQGRRTAGGH